MTTSTVEAFLASPLTEEDFEETPEPITDPLLSIAESLRTIAHGMTAPTAPTAVPAEPVDVQASADYGDEIRQLGEAYDELEAKHRALFDLLAEVEKIIKPSTSKLANNVREAINAWRIDESSTEPVEAAPVGKPEVEPGREAIVDPASQCLACGRYFADQELLDAHTCTAVAPVPEQPAPDASLEEWREYAYLHGIPANDMNRSQIRSALGLPHFTPAGTTP